MFTAQIIIINKTSYTVFPVYKMIDVHKNFKSYQISFEVKRDDEFGTKTNNLRAKQ